MKFTLSWLKDHLDTDASLAEIGRTLTMIGLEVEEIHDPGAALGGFIVGHVRSAEKHPDADKLRVCMVDTGAETLQIVCGAPNARAGIKVALARPGDVIPATGDKLKKGKIRGVESRGMMCSSRELCLGDDHDGIIELPEDTPVGTPLADVLRTDPVIDIAVTPNRADALGVRGVARDLAAVGLGTLKPDPLIAPVEGTFDSPIQIRRDLPEDAGEACPLFVGRYIKGVKNGESPQWLKDRLTEVGLRPISALVDITNYATIGWGRPLHVFDADTLTGDVVVRMARDGEVLDALNDKSYTLDNTVCVIADQAKAQSIGGVVGGEETGCTEETVNVFLEAALFDPRRIARTARKLSIESDAKHRFERGVDPASALWGIHLATHLIQEFCGGEVSVPVIAGDTPDWHREIAFRPARVAKLVGVEVPEADMAAGLERLGCTVTTAVAGEAWSVVPPSWRADLEEEHDLVEEVARLHGYDNIPVVPMPRASMPTPVLSPRQKVVRQATRGLAARGLRETVTWSFCATDHARLFGGGDPAMVLANPISADLDCMRPSVLPHLVLAVGRNAARGFSDLALFEIGPQFNGPEPGEQALMATGLRAGRTGPRHWDAKPRSVDVFDAKADAIGALAAAGTSVDSLRVEAEAPAHYHPGRSGALKLGPKVLAYFGDLHPAVLKALDVKGPVAGFEVFLEAVPLPKAKPTKARPLLKPSPFQPLERDFAFVLDSAVAADAVVRAAKGADKAMIADVRVFDLYEGANMPEGKKSLAITAVLQPTDKTLTDEEIEVVSNKVISAVEKATGGVLRG